jgi:hypothetical protein
MFHRELSSQPPAHADIAIVVDDGAEDVPGHVGIIPLAWLADAPLFRGCKTKVPAGSLFAVLSAFIKGGRFGLIGREDPGLFFKELQMHALLGVMRVWLTRL